MASDKPDVPVAHPANTITADDLKTVKTMIGETLQMVGQHLALGDLAGLARAFQQIADKVGGMEKLAVCLDTLSDLGSK